MFQFQRLALCIAICAGLSLIVELMVLCQAFIRTKMLIVIFFAGTLISAPIVYGFGRIHSSTLYRYQVVYIFFGLLTASDYVPF